MSKTELLSAFLPKKKVNTQIDHSTKMKVLECIHKWESDPKMTDFQMVAQYGGKVVAVAKELMKGK